jgi:hypothetical protein
MMRKGDVSMKGIMLKSLGCLSCLMVASGSIPKQGIRAHGLAGENDCHVVGSVKAPAIVQIWQETPDGKNGKSLWGPETLERDQVKDISTDNGRIRFSYKFNDQDPWTDNVGADCIDGNNVPVP